MRIVLPKENHDIDPCYGPLFFLMGPVQGGGDWQNECCWTIRARIERFYVAIPQRYPDTHPLSSHFVAGNGSQFTRQLAWEIHFIKKAAMRGCILAWLPRESETDPRPRENGPYAQDTYGELGRYGRMTGSDPSLSMVVGAEPEFFGLSCIQRNLSEDYGRDFPIHGSLGDTVDAAIAKASAKASS